jgi:hypothetical protein
MAVSYNATAAFQNMAFQMKASPFSAGGTPLADNRTGAVHQAS